MEYRDYYKVLGVERSATQDEIKRAYRKLVRKHHPDVAGASNAAAGEAKFKELGEAYEVLHDPEKRAAYDQLGANWQDGQSFRPPPDWNAGFGFSGREGKSSPDEDVFSSIFEQMFARRSGGAGSDARAGPEFHAQGQDHHARIVIDLREAYEGATRNITLRAPELDASGHVVLRERTIRVTIPKGVTEGQHIRIAGKGSPGLGQGRAGDLYLEVALRDDPAHRVEGRDVFMDLPITPWEAALGARITLHTPSGPVELTVPRHAQAGKKLRLKGRGIPGKPAGDLYAVLKIVIPPTESARARSLYEELAKETQFDPRSRMKG